MKEQQRELFTRLFLHILLIVFITIKIFDWNILNADYGRSLNRTYFFLFGTEAMIESPNNNQIYTYDEFYGALTRVMTEYHNIQSTSVSNFQYGYRDKPGSGDCSSSPETLTVTTFYWSDSTHIHSYKKEVSNMADFDFIFNDTASYFSSLDSIRIGFDLCNYQPQTLSYLASSSCNYWQIHIIYKFIAQLYLEVSIDSNMDKSCSGMNVHEALHDYITIIEIFTLFTCIVYCIYILKDIKTAVFLYFHVKESHRVARLKYLQDPKLCTELEAVAAQYEWKEIPTGIKRSFHCYWSLLTLFSVSFLLIDSIYTLTARDFRYVYFSPSEKFLTGLSCLFLWSTLVQFLFFFPALYALAVTIQTAIPRILAFLAGFMPIYFAFIFLGIGLFGYKLGMFSGFPMAASSMFAFINGDSIQPILILMEHRSYIAAVLYGVFFILLSTYLLLNIMVAIVEEAYFLSRKKSRFLDYLMWKNLQSMATSQPSTIDELKLREGLKNEAKQPIQDEDMDGLNDDEEDEWLQNVYSSIYTRNMPQVNPDNLHITLAEEAAEMYILGKSHWEYSKMMDYLAEQLSTNK